MMDRRAFITALAGGLLAAPLAAKGQQVGKVPRIGVLAPGSPPLEQFDAFRPGLRDLGYTEGQTIILDPRWDEGSTARHASLVADLVRLRVDIIVAGTTPTAVAAQKATRTIPIVMAAIADPVGAGLIASLARPGGNITGMSLISAELSGKRIGLLKEAIPSVSRVAVLWNPMNPNTVGLLHDTTRAAQSLGIQVQVLEGRNGAEIDAAFESAVKGGAQALVTVQDVLFTLQRARIAEIARKSKIPTMSGESGFAAAGGLLNYGPNIADSWRRSAVYVDRILKGAEPGDLPIEQPTKFELVINLKTAKALGLTIPPSLLQRADQVIE
jgi:putative ABC transport system substrate-binding protein